jgi:hypothetical protein
MFGKESKSDDPTRFRFNESCECPRPLFRCFYITCEKAARRFGASGTVPFGFVPFRRNAIFERVLSGLIHRFAGASRTAHCIAGATQVKERDLP